MMNFYLILLLQQVIQSKECKLIEKHKTTLCGTGIQYTSSQQTYF